MNAFLSGLLKKRFGGLQIVQNAAARVLTGAGKYKHITPVLASLHWFPCQGRADFKELLLTYKIVNSIAQSYLNDRIISYAPSCTSLPSIDSW